MVIINATPTPINITVPKYDIPLYAENIREPKPIIVVNVVIRIALPTFEKLFCKVEFSKIFGG